MGSINQNLWFNLLYNYRQINVNCILPDQYLDIGQVFIDFIDLVNWSKK